MSSHLIIIIIINIIYSLEFFKSANADGFHWSLRDSKSPQVPWTPLIILAVLSNVVVWMNSTRPPTSKSSSPFSNPLVTVRNAPITNDTTVTCMLLECFHWSLSYSKSSQVTSTILSILADLNRVVVWMVSTRPFTHKSASLFYKLLVTVPRVLIYHYYYYYYYSLRAFHTSVSWWSFRRVCL